MHIDNISQKDSTSTFDAFQFGTTAFPSWGLRWIAMNWMGVPTEAKGLGFSEAKGHTMRMPAYWWKSPYEVDNSEQKTYRMISLPQATSWGYNLSPTETPSRFKVAERFCHWRFWRLCGPMKDDRGSLVITMANERGLGLTWEYTEVQTPEIRQIRRVASSSEQIELFINNSCGMAAPRTRHWSACAKSCPSKISFHIKVSKLFGCAVEHM